MKKKDIYIGTIKKCNNLYLYEKYGEKRYVGDFRTRTMEFGHTENYVDICEENVPLIDVGEEKYIFCSDVNSFLDLFLVNVGFVNTIGAVPVADNTCFVDKNSLIPYFKFDENKRVTVKTLKRIK